MLSKSWKWSIATAGQRAVILAAFALPVVPDNLAAQGQPVETGSELRWRLDRIWYSLPTLAARRDRRA